MDDREFLGPSLAVSSNWGLFPEIGGPLNHVSR